MREAWFPELERVLNSGKDEYFVPENTRAFGAPCRPGLTLHGWGGESGTTAAGRDRRPHDRPPPPPTRPRTAGRTGLQASFYLTVQTPLLLALTPLPRQDVGIPWTQKP